MLSLGKGEGTNYSIGIPFIEVGKDNYGKPKQRMIISPFGPKQFCSSPKSLNDHIKLCNHVSMRRPMIRVLGTWFFLKAPVGSV